MAVWSLDVLATEVLEDIAEEAMVEERGRDMSKRQG